MRLTVRRWGASCGAAERPPRRGRSIGRVEFHRFLASDRLTWSDHGVATPFSRLQSLRRDTSSPRSERGCHQPCRNGTKGENQSDRWEYVRQSHKSQIRRHRWPRLPFCRQLGLVGQAASRPAAHKTNKVSARHQGTPCPYNVERKCPCRDSNPGTRFRKPLLYPPELQGHAVYEAVLGLAASQESSV